MRESLPSFFGFEAVGVLMYNFEQNQFFTDPDTSKDEQKESGEASGSDDENNDDEENSMMGSDMGTPMNMEKKAKKKVFMMKITRWILSKNILFPNMMQS